MEKTEEILRLAQRLSKLTLEEETNGAKLQRLGDEIHKLSQQLKELVLLKIASETDPIIDSFLIADTIRDTEDHMSDLFDLFLDLLD